MAKKSRIVLGLPEGGYLGLCVPTTSVFFASEKDAKKHGRKPPFQTELPPGMATEVYDSPDKIPADFCGGVDAAAPTVAASAAKPQVSTDPPMRVMDDTTCYWVNGMIVCT